MASRPTLIYDGKCGFCRIWLDYWRKLTGDRVDYIASQEIGDRFSQIPRGEFSKSVQLVRSDGSVASGAQAVFETLEKERLYSWIATPAEWAYRIVAGHRNFFYYVTKYTFGTSVEPARFEATQWVFLRALALIYLIAFVSLASQIQGLVGERGILPVGRFLSAVAQSGGAIRYLAVPSLFWLASDDTALRGLCWFGAGIAFLLFVTGFIKGRQQRTALVSLYILYLSLVSVGQDFLGFQWDALLLEAGFLAIFLGHNRIVPWLFRALAFRLFFLSGAVKLLSGDPTWSNLSALSYHWYTQPLPTPLAWYVNLLPLGIQKLCTLGTLAIELVVPFCFFFPRKIREAGAWLLIGLQALIILTGNYTFFNLLSIALCLFAFDDRKLARLSFAKQVAAIVKLSAPSRLERGISIAVAVIVLVLGLLHIGNSFSTGMPTLLRRAINYAAPLGIVNSYGLFAQMTTVRDEITIEGSMDGQSWQPYRFRYKPNTVRDAPHWVAPYQPRLDWQMWFAALGSYSENQWFVNLAERLLQGSPPVLGLFESNPFPDQPPKYIRANKARFTFTKVGGAQWWSSEPAGAYLPAVSFRGAQNQ